MVDRQLECCGCGAARIEGAFEFTSLGVFHVFRCLSPEWVVNGGWRFCESVGVCEARGSVLNPQPPCASGFQQTVAVVCVCPLRECLSPGTLVEPLVELKSSGRDAVVSTC